MKSNFFPVTFKSIGVAALIAAIFGGGYLYRGTTPISEAHATANIAAVAPTQAMGGKFVALPDFSSMVAQQGPAVVNISASGMVKTDLASNPGMPQLDPNDPFYEFFKRFQMPAPEKEYPMQALGSGFIVKSDGTILTNAHVVADADEVTVKLTDKREFKAKVLGIDKTSDVAVLKIDADNLPTVNIGNPQNSRVGEWVVAIGSPFGFENSVTAGIISAKSRSLPDDGYVPFLQTDVAINPGNSGGPLFNMSGEVIGINSQIYSRSGGYQGLSFAIPIDVAMKVEQQLLDHGKVRRGRLGVGIQSVNQELAKSFGLDKPEGALVSSVDSGSPADKAGIEPGDIILKFNGKEIDRSEELPPLVADFAPGDTAKLEIWHDKKAKEISLRVGEMKTAEADAPAAAQTSNVRLGLAVRPLSQDEQRQADVHQGLLVEDVSDGPAARAGIQPGDVILSVNGEKVKSVDQLRSLVEKNRNHLALLVMRDDSKMFVPIHIG